MTRVPKTLASGLLALSLALSGAALALEEEEDDFASMSILTHEDLTVVSTTGVAIVAKIEEARSEISRSELRAARARLVEVQALIRKARNVSPGTRLADQIHAAIEGGARSEDLLPIYTELDVVTDVEEFSETRELVDQAKGQLQAGETEEASARLIEAAASVRYLEIDLPLRETSAAVDKALLKLYQHRDVTTAKALLTAALQHITIVQESISVAIEEVDVEEDVGTQ